MGRLLSGLAGLLMGASLACASPQQISKQDKGWTHQYGQGSVSSELKKSNLDHLWFAIGNKIHVVDAETGIEQYTEDTGETNLPEGAFTNYNLRSISHSDIDDDGKDETLVAVAGKEKGELWLYDAQDTVPITYSKRKFTLEDQIVGGADISKLLIVTAGYNGTVYAFNTKFAEQWRRDITLPEEHYSKLIYGAPVISGDNVIVLGDHGYIFCLDSNTGEPQWEPKKYNHWAYAGRMRVNTSPFVNDGKIITFSLDRLRSIFDEFTGEMLEQEKMSSRQLDPGMMRLYQKYEDVILEKGKTLQPDTIRYIGKNNDSLYFGTWQGKVGKTNLEE